MNEKRNKDIEIELEELEGSQNITYQFLKEFNYISHLSMFL